MDQAKDGQESSFYMTTPSFISVRLLSLLEDYLSAFRDWVKNVQKCVSVKGGHFEGL